VEDPHVILVSFDGFSHEYVEKFDTPNFDNFIKQGASAEMMVPSYPSKTFPNHYSLVTGLHPGNHGLVDNTFYDRERKEIYRIRDRSKVEDPYFYGGTPLWQLTQQHGMKSASYFWVGSEAKIKGSFPDYYHIYDGSVTNEARIEQATEWLELDATERPRFITLYFSFIDDVGHNFGPNSPKIEEAVLEADRLLGLLMDGISKLSLNINVILVSDHGMHPMDNDKDTFVMFDDFFDYDHEGFIGINTGTHAHIYQLEEDEEQLDSLYHVIDNSGIEGFSLYRQDEFPEFWNYKNERVGDIFLMADPGKYFINRGRETSTWNENWGTHGFNPYQDEYMGAIFYANGPNIIPGSRIGSFDNVDIYPFIAKILGMAIPHVDGDLEELKTVYQE
jgi:predicted AlkP superfamily pyrophosphatase or phosphodiesterase